MRHHPITIVGGSLSGLTLALACAKYSVPVRVLERVKAVNRTGGALGIDRKLLARVTGLDPSRDGAVPHLPVVTSYREATSWLALHNWLREQATRSSFIELIEGATVEEVEASASSIAVKTAEFGPLDAELVVGADGYKSVVRRSVNPDHPFADYAGYVLWRGLVDERKLPRSTEWPDDDDGLGIIDAAGFRLIAYPVPGTDGSVRPGERQISFAWYDITREALLRQLQCLSPEGYVLGTLTQDKISEPLRRELLEFARELWPNPWRTFVLHAIQSKHLFATPICEYRPQRVVRGRTVIIGDAGHVASPMTGLGFVTAAADADALARILGEVMAGTGELDGALETYESFRLPDAQRLVKQSMQWSQKYVQLARHSFSSNPAPENTEYDT